MIGVNVQTVALHDSLGEHGIDVENGKISFEMFCEIAAGLLLPILVRRDPGVPYS